MSRLKITFILVTISSMLGLTVRCDGAQLTSGTLSAWSHYLAGVEASNRQRVSGDRFLWIDDKPANADQLRNGELRVKPAVEQGSFAVPGGLIHHWIGAAFIPHTSIGQVVRVTRDYRRYKEYFNPEVVDSHLIRQSGDNDQFSLRWATKVLFVSAGIETRCQAQNVRLDERRFYQTAYTTQVQEIRDYGKADERTLAPDQGDGFVWRLYTITRYAARDGGVYLEIEAIALTRDIPSSLKIFISSLVRRISRNSLLLSLRQTRDAVLASGIGTTMARNAPSAKTIDLAHAN